MQAKKLAIPEVVLFEPKVFGDERGFFFESFNQKIFEEATGLKREFVQDNHSKSSKGVLRGLHYQLPPMAQGKLVRVTQGEPVPVLAPSASEKSLSSDIFSRDSTPTFLRTCSDMGNSPTTSCGNAVP